MSLNTIIFNYVILWLQMGLTSCLKNCNVSDPLVNALKPIGLIRCLQNEQQRGGYQINKECDAAHAYTEQNSRPVETKNEKQRFVFYRLIVEKIFASLAIVKAYYALIQFAFFPYNAVLITHLDKLIVSEFGSLFSLLKSLHVSESHEFSGDEFVLAMHRELSACIRTYKTVLKKLKSRTKTLASQISHLREELDRTNALNKALLVKAGCSGSVSLTVDEDFQQLKMMKMSYFVSELRHTTRSIQHFVKVMVNRMRLAGWDLNAAATALQPGLSYWGTTDICLAFEAYICSEMFEAFQFPNFGLSKESSPHPKSWRSYFAQKYLELKSTNPAVYLSNNPDSLLATFFRLKYQRVINPKMELSLFGNMNFRNHIKLGGVPEAPFVDSFLAMAKRILRLHYLALSIDPDASIFQVPKGCQFSEVYMESVHEVPFMLSDCSSSQVAFTVVPGFKLFGTIVQCEVYLSKPEKIL